MDGSFESVPSNDAPRLREALPRHFEPQVMSLIEHIDVLWLRGNRVEAAFEVGPPPPSTQGCCACRT
jgi:hypothetical protein